MLGIVKKLFCEGAPLFFFNRLYALFLILIHPNYLVYLLQLFNLFKVEKANKDADPVGDVHCPPP